MQNSQFSSDISTYPIVSNDSCLAEDSSSACHLCHDVQETWRLYQFQLYQLTAGLSLLTNLITILVMLRRGISYACHLHTVVMAIADAAHSLCAAIITRIIMSGGVSSDLLGACWCKLLYYAYFLSKAMSNWTILVLSVGLWLSLSQPFRATRMQKVKVGTMVTFGQLALLLGALSPRLVYVDAPTAATDRTNFLCTVHRTSPGFRCFALLETFVIALVLPIGANLVVCLANVCRLKRLSNGFGNRSIRRAVLATGTTHAALHTPYAGVLAAMQLGLLDKSSGSYYLAICLYYAATAWYSLSCVTNFLAYVTFYQGFRRTLFCGRLNLKK